MAARLAEINHFLQKHWPTGDYELSAISGDASFRRYFRVKRQGGTWILMDAPGLADDSFRFIAIADAYAKAGLVVPEVIAFDAEAGLVLLSDLGDELLQFHLHESNVIERYRQALALLPVIRQITSSDFGDFPKFDREFLLRELNIFTEWFVQKHLQIALTTEIKQLLDETFEPLVHSAMQQVQAGMHRDFHSRNLMLQSNGSIAVIDFQDAVIGPVTYDAVSLLKDCYLSWPEELIAQLRTEFFQQLQQQGVLAKDYEVRRFQREFELMGMQRHIKVLGIFCRLWHRDGKAGYLADLPRVFAYVLAVCDSYPEFAGFAKWLRQEVEPLLIRSLS